MPWTSLRFSPGIVRNTTRYASSGTWFDGSLVRFREGYPEKWGGWVDTNPGYVMAGVCRSLHRHGDFAGNRWTSLGTSSRFYMKNGDFQYDVTPLAETAGPLSGAFSTTTGSNIVTIEDDDHRHYPGDTVFISGVTTAVGGIPASELGTPDPYDPPTEDNPGVEHLITGWVDENHYQITVATEATSTSTGGGGTTTTLTYLFRAGNPDVTAGGGWGRLSWGEDEWNRQPGSYQNVFDQLGVWTQDNWGEDLVGNALNGPIFYWRASSPDERMIDILDIPADYLGDGAPGADGNAPANSQFIIISHRDRHLLAFGCTQYNSVDVAPMMFRWCSQEAITNWDEADLNGTAGSLPLSNGSKFIAGLATAGEILVWTDQALYSIQYIGSPLIYSAELLDRWSDICGLKARCSFNGVVYWMGQGGFYAYGGRTEKIPCPVWDYISVRLNRDQMAKVYASGNQAHNEVMWFYPSNASGNLEIDSYVAFDVVQGIWHYGALARTAWMDLDAISAPVATEPPVSQPQGAPLFRLFEHDHGSDDGSTNPPSPINAFIESGPIELSSEGAYDKGDRMIFVRRIMPDVTFRDITDSSVAPQMNIVLKMMDEPGGGFWENSSSQVQRSATIPVEQFTSPTADGIPTNNRIANVRLRGRSMTFRAESNTLGCSWRLGVPRIDGRTDGQR